MSYEHPPSLGTGIATTAEPSLVISPRASLLGRYPNPRMSDGKTPLQAILFNQTRIHYQRRYPVLHNSAAAYVVAIVWLLVIVVGMGRALLKG